MFRTMFRTGMLAGLMGATLLGGIAPAHAQNMREPGAWRGEGRGDGAGRGNGQPRGDMQRPSRTDMPQQGWQNRPVSPQGQPSVQPGVRPEQRAGQQWDGNRNWSGGRAATPDQGWQRAPGNAPRPQWNGNGGQDMRWNNGADRGRDPARDWRTNPRDDRRWTDNGTWSANNRNNGGWNNGGWNGARGYDARRYDDRTRWNTQRRWDSGWRQDNRYDWYSYRNRYGDRYRLGNYYAPRGWDYGYRRFSVGIFIDSLLYSNSYWLNDPYAYRLPPAYGTLRWVRYYDDALLVDIRDGYVVDVIHDFFW